MNYTGEIILQTINKMLAVEENHLEAFTSEQKKFKVGLLIIRKRGKKTYFSELINGQEKGITEKKTRLQKVLRSYETDILIGECKRNINILQKASVNLKNQGNLNIHPQLTKVDLLSKTYSAADEDWMSAPFASNLLYMEEFGIF